MARVKVRIESEQVMGAYVEGAKAGAVVELDENLARIALAEGWASKPGAKKKEAARPKARTTSGSPIRPRGGRRRSSEGGT